MTRHHHPRPRNADTTRAAILQAAEDFFARDGFAGARVDAIAAASGYNKRLIFLYFGDKLGLYQSVVRRMKERLDERTAEVTRPFVQDPEAAVNPAQIRQLIETGVRWTFNYYLAHLNYVRILAWEAAGGWRTFNAIETEQEQRESMILRRAQEAGIIRNDLDPILALLTVAGMALQFHTSLPRYQHVVPSVDWTSPEALARAREQIVAHAVNAIMANPEGELPGFPRSAATQPATSDRTEAQPGNGHVSAKPSPGSGLP
jgi:AcrR family transcriptional regulator